MEAPLAASLRPVSLDDIVGQSKIIEKMRSYIASGRIPSMIFRGSPGTWKTTLAMVLSHEIEAIFISLSGVSSKKSDLSEIIHQAQIQKQYGRKTIVFLDEIHRRNKAQQDALLPYVENGTLILIGATTENPSFTINNALLSRSKVIVFEPLTSEDISIFISKSMSAIQQLYPWKSISEDVVSLIADLANGDLRNALNLLESALMLSETQVTSESITNAFGHPVYYDRDGDEHYNIISAVHKSLRDSDGDAACYRIQRMLQWGEDPLYICRRLVRFASEDIGPADHNALVMANTVYETCAKLWMPECDTALMQLALYLAKAKKDNICYVISQQTKADIATHGNLPVPLHIRNAASKLMKELKYWKGYKYAHDFKDAVVEQEHFPDKLQGRKYW